MPSGLCLFQAVSRRQVFGLSLDECQGYRLRCAVDHHPKRVVHLAAGASGAAVDNLDSPSRLLTLHVALSPATFVQRRVDKLRPGIRLVEHCYTSEGRIDDNGVRYKGGIPFQALTRR